MMGLALKGLRRFDRSKIAFQRAIDIEIDSGSPGPIRETASRELVDIYEKTKDYESLADYLGFSIANEGPRQTLYFQAVVANLRAGRVEQSAELAKLASRMPQGEERSYIEAASSALRGHFSRALDQLESVTPTPRVQRLQARLHYLAGNPILAKQTLIQLIHNLENPDLFVIAALAKLERLDQPHDKFAASPMLKAVIESLTGSELKIVSQMTLSNFWTIKGDELPAAPS